MKPFLTIQLVALSFAITSCTTFQEEEVPVSFGVDVNHLDFTAAPSTQSLKVSSGQKWDVTSMPSWVILETISRTGYSPYEWVASFSASENDEYNREGLIIIKAGTDVAEITVTQDGKKGKYIAVESVSLSQTELTLTEGENASLTAVITPSNASVKEVTWTTSNSSVATVSQTGRIDAIAEGTALITVTTDDGNKTASCAVTVKAKVIPVTGVSLDKTSITLTVGDVQELIATVIPSDATDKSVTWSSSNSSIASVSSAGVVTAKAAGSATITVTTNDGGKTTKCSVTVSEAVIEAIDLGLSVKWGSFNLGANKPEEAGAYYSWGEIYPKNEYTWQNYKFRVSGDRYDNVTFSKYVLNPSFGTVDNKSVLDPEDDAAHMHLGGSWRMPTADEVRELIDNCTAEWTTLNGVNGRKLTSKKTGYTDKWIFLPAAGYRYETSFYSSEGAYWTSSLYNDYAHYLCVSSQYFYLDSYARLFGYSIRPVYGDPAKVSVTSVSLNKTNLTMMVGDTQTLTATVSPSNATDNSVTWSSSNTPVATVSSSGVVTAKAVGTAIITVTTNDGGKMATCSVTIKSSSYSVAVPEIVDLGLSVKWASFNLGASKPEEYGDYFAWGETEPKKNYYWNTYKFSASADGPFSKYNYGSAYGPIDNKMVLDPEDDAAAVLLGGKWRMPTVNEVAELCDAENCIWTPMTRNGINGYLVTSKIDGSNGNSIFIPAAGNRVKDQFKNQGSEGVYWSSSLSSNDPYAAYVMVFVSYGSLPRFNGLTIRPVYAE